MIPQRCALYLCLEPEPAGGISVAGKRLSWGREDGRPCISSSEPLLEAHTTEGSHLQASGSPHMGAFWGREYPTQNPHPHPFTMGVTLFPAAQLCW